MLDCKYHITSCITSCSFFRHLSDLVGALQPQPLSLSTFTRQQPIPLPLPKHITHTPQSVEQSIM